ncbi:LytR C-terminal domain-containing protein [Streptomyces indicus]|uniref:LytR cell envelope-related transcriptional attenuator n=1 Tax=Streptomyces indicus TaxID=417292 RepID=A0A1G9ER44_9ACTN|nr:LytR C-terminal domain-containing protein [Streptomyces indicus]SDK78475.1 LytR cell envelope-related transcriptional attenuator [Streptomyces indicus]
MSMLTPPGMGGEYRITGDKYPRMRRNRRRRRIVLAVFACVAVLGLLTYGTIELIGVFSGEKSDRGERTVAANKPEPDCKPAPSAPSKPKKPPMVLPEPADVQVNVFNATPRGGLAKETADELKKRGFTVGKVGNAEKKFDKKVKGEAILLGPKSTLTKGMVVLGTQVAGAETQTDTRKTADIDLILGAGFKSLATKEDAAKALDALTKPAPAPQKPKGC